MTQHKLFVCTLCRFSNTQKEYEGLRGGQHLTGAVPYQERPEAIKRKLFVVLPPS